MKVEDVDILERRLRKEADRRNSIARCETDMPYWCEYALKLRTKAGGDLAPFILNDAQRKLHELLEKQKADTGRVRAIVLKARQLGISTYVAARLLHKTIYRPGIRTLVVRSEERRVGKAW